MKKVCKRQKNANASAEKADMRKKIAHSHMMSVSGHAQDGRYQSHEFSDKNSIKNLHGCKMLRRGKKYMKHGNLRPCRGQYQDGRDHLSDLVPRSVNSSENQCICLGC